jgi:hypothetical protein
MKYPAVNRCQRAIAAWPPACECYTCLAEDYGCFDNFFNLRNVKEAV